MTQLSWSVRPLRKVLLPLAFLTILALPFAAHSAELPATVSNALKEAGIPLRSAAIIVQAVDSNQPLIRHNAQQAMNPASAMKLVTTYAALELLGPAYIWKTTVLTDVAPTNGILEGNLYLRGSGDPRLALEQFWLLLRQLLLPSECSKPLH
ncbi:MAG: D-alanyl-D-alanine carboxypeptidase, partial [Betaproteobacteria bacterium]